MRPTELIATRSRWRLCLVAAMRPTALVPALLLCTAAGAAEPPDAWRSSVQRDIAASEYHLTWRPEKQAFEAPNRAQGLRATFGPQGIHVSPRENPSWEWGLSLRGFDVATPSAVGARVEYDRGRVVEWYVNEPRGIEQGFTLLAPPTEEEKEVHLDLALSGTLFPVVAEDGQAIDFATPDGRRVLHYAQLVVKDAAGRTLRAWMEGIPGGIRVAFAGEDAVYPVTVDPLATSASWTTTSSGGYGFAVGAAGDVNGDGYGDVVVAAPFFIGTTRGRVYVYLGSASGPSTTPATTLVNPIAGDHAYGWDAGTAGDVNGDGYADLLVGRLTDEILQDSEVYLYLGSPTGITTPAAWSVTTGFRSEVLVGTAGDVNGDGYSDVIFGAPKVGGRGRARVFHGSAAGLFTTPAWTVDGGAIGDRFGIAVGTAGDVNGDGYADVIVGASYVSGDSGAAYVYHGSPTGLALGPSWTVLGSQAGAYFGTSAGTAGDTNGDGYADVIVGAPWHANGQTKEGRAFVYFGSATGLSTTALWVAESNQIEADFGLSVATAGDVNGDGYADVVVGAPRFDQGLTDQGRAYVFLGSSSGPIPVPGWTAAGTLTSGHSAWSVDTVGDVNGDGFGDVIVGANPDDPPPGVAQIYLGSASGLDTFVGWVREGDQGDAWFGLSVAGAGDVDGDGYGDVLVGAPSYDGGEADEGRVLLFRGSALGTEPTEAWAVESDQANAWLGFSVASAGDVNGDGFADAVVGTPRWSNGEAEEGRAQVYLGSPAGLAASAVWTMESNSSSANYGRVVASAGDVNGDGYADLLVGAPYFDNGMTDEGKADLYLGSATGPAATPAWTVEGNKSSAALGWSLGTAGDTNRDGFADVIVGVPGYANGQANEGGALLYLGSASGLATATAWTAESNQNNAFLGRAVGAAGDVNGDGYADAIVAAEGYSNGQTGEGRAWLYLGGATGLAIGPVWSAESDQANAHFGYTAGTAGDVNGDGFADVIVGAPDWDGPGGANAGKAFVFHGNPSGLNLVPNWTAEIDTFGGFLGASVAAAGDVNGDGYGDVLVGVPFDDDGKTEIDEGTALLYKGGFRGGALMRPRQRRVSGSAPVPRFGTVDSPDTFRFDLLGRSPFGRGKVRLEWEVKPLGTAFDGTGTQLVPAFVDSGVSGTQFAQLVTGLTPSTRYHWRARLRYDAVTTPWAPFSRWVTIPWGGWNEAMLRTRAPAVPAGDVPGLTIAKATGGQLTLSWSASCTATDTDSEVYEGTLGTWYSHHPRSCTTSGSTSHTLTPLAGDRYFLIVPRNLDREGSYGLTSTGAERPQGTPICKVRETGACP